MSEHAVIAEDLRSKIISQPDVILEDIDLMRALLARSDDAVGANVFDLRSIAMQRLEERLDRLEDTHRNVIAAAYDNLSGADQIQRAVLRMLEAQDFVTFLNDLGGEVADILRVDALRIVLETTDGGRDDSLHVLSDVLRTGHPGFIDDYLNRGRSQPERQVTLRPCQGAAPLIYGTVKADLRSEACLRLDLGSGRLPGLLIMGSEDPKLFSATQGTDLLAFFAAAFERSLRRWLG